ncbi:MAG TPA: type I-E CRISPR-associated protein Cse2/CasB [Chthonomonadaceae bacterium]|nr:type I-E CRISPR-associated protein Cse2/CasB [Chthonomonadaceae bacterium]
MMHDEERIADYRLISHLARLHEDHDKRNDVDARGKLANLRYAMRDRLHTDYPVGRVFPALAEGALSDNPERNEWRTLIAGLYGYAHDEVAQRDGVSLGTALRDLFEARQNESLERRFMALLNTDPEQLPGHLRQAISLLKAEKIGLDWKMLLDQAAAWSASGRWVQKRWTRDYYRSRKPAVEGAVSDATTAL